MDLDGQKASKCVSLSLAVVSRLLYIYKVMVGSEDREQIVTRRQCVERMLSEETGPLGLIELIIGFNCDK